MTVTQAPARARPAAPPNRLGAWLLAPAPPTRLAALRVLIGAYAAVHLLVTAPSFLQVVDLPARQFDPVGLLSWMPSPVAPATAAAVLGLTLAAGVGLILGWRWRLIGPVFAAGSERGGCLVRSGRASRAGASSYSPTCE